MSLSGRGRKTSERHRDAKIESEKRKRGRQRDHQKQRRSLDGLCRVPNFRNLHPEGTVKEKKREKKKSLGKQ